YYTQLTIIKPLFFNIFLLYVIMSHLLFSIIILNSVSLFSHFTDILAPKFIDIIFAIDNPIPDPSISLSLTFSLLKNLSNIYGISSCFIYTPLYIIYISVYLLYFCFIIIYFIYFTFFYF